MKGTRESAGCPLTRVYEEIDILSPRKALGIQALKHSGGGRAVQRHSLSYCAAMKIISAAKLPISQKSSMAQRVTRHLRLLRQLKYLTASKTPMVSDYPRNFGNAAKDGLKGTTRWAVYYLTNPISWYPVLERAMILSAISAIQPLLPLQVTVQSI